MPNAVALIHEEAGVYGISFPDFPGCISTADSLDDAIARGAMALALHVEGMREDGDDLPVLRSASDIRRTVEIGDAILAAVPVELPGRTVRVQITMDEHLLAALDRSAEASGASRSGKIAEVVRDALVGRDVNRMRTNSVTTESVTEEALEIAKTIVKSPDTAPDMLVIAKFILASHAERERRSMVGAHLDLTAAPRKVSAGKTNG